MDFRTVSRSVAVLLLFLTFTEASVTGKGWNSGSGGSFKCTELGSFQDPENCRQYYVCSEGDVQGEFKLDCLVCSQRTIFYEDRTPPICDYPGATLPENCSQALVLEDYGTCK